MAGTHLSVRIDPETIARLDKLSRRSGRSRSWLAKTLIEEGLRMDAHPGIVFRDGPAGRRAGLARGPDVWEVMNTFEDRDHPTEEDITYVAESLVLSVPEVRYALGYYSSFKEEIDDWIRSNDEEAEAAYAAWLAQQGSSSR
jgi:predicted transcriptional regulator